MQMGSRDVLSALEACLELIHEHGMGIEESLERFPEHRDELRRLLPVALKLDQARSLTAPDELRKRIQARIDSTAQIRENVSPGLFVTSLAALRSIVRDRTSIPQRRAQMIPAIVTFLVIAVLSMGGLVAGADAAGPGDLLFGLDTAIEDVRLSLTRDDEHEVELKVEFATERLEELKIEIEGEGDREDIEWALAEFQAALAEIETLLGELPPEQRAAFESALALLIASAPNVSEFEFEFEIEDGSGEIDLEIESDDDDDLEDDDLDEDDDCDSSGPGGGDCPDDDVDDDDQDDDGDLDDDDLDEDDDDCDSSGSGSGDCPEDDDLDDDDLDEDDDDCDSSGPGSGSCDSQEDKDDHDDDSDDEHDDSDS